ncbi:MAG: J domain-containing protein [Paludibacteraceae bacterium]|nr:J domain-containing protein [Paludibacteraceae bacterium]
MELLEKDKVFLKDYKQLCSRRDKCLLWYILTSILLSITITVFVGDYITVDVDIVDIVDIVMVGTTLLSAFICLMVFSIKRKKFWTTNYGISKQEAERLYYTLSNVKFTCYLPILQRICRLNPEAKSTQIELINNWLPIDAESITEYVFNLEYSEEDWDDIVNQIKETDPVEKKKIVNKLFQLVILDDGIHKDEWNLLMQLMVQIQFNKHYINYFKERYEPLRTEFDEYEKRSNSSENRYVYSLKEYYTTLGLDENATDEEVRRAYHELALQHHPDLPKNADRMDECEKMMMKINEAYEKVRG